MSALLMGHFQEEMDTYLLIDTSKIAIGSLLGQNDSNTKRYYSVAYVSRRRYEKNYSSCNVKILNLVYSLDHFIEMCIGRHVVVYSSNVAIQ